MDAPNVSPQVKDVCLEHNLIPTEVYDDLKVEAQQLLSALRAAGDNVEFLIRENNQLREKLGMPLRGVEGFQPK